MSRYQNQIDLINVTNFNYLNIAVIGVGAIGSWIAIALNKLGFENFILVDDDVVEKHNVPSQFYTEKDIGDKKVTSLMSKMEGKISAFPTKLLPSDKIEADVVFICVDSLKQRKGILKAVLESYESTGRPKLIIDGRMRRLVFRVYTVPLNDNDVLKKYTESLMKKEEEGPCTEKGIIQNVFAVVSVMVEQFRKIINGVGYSPVINCDFERLLFISEDEKQIIKEEKEQDKNDK